MHQSGTDMIVEYFELKVQRLTVYVLRENDVLENEADNDFAYEEYLETEDEDWNGDSCWGCHVDLADRSQQLRFSYTSICPKSAALVRGQKRWPAIEAYVFTYGGRVNS